MKKFSILLASLLTAAAGIAQTDDAPNRILVTNTEGNYTGYVIDYLDQISFARVDGEVLAKVDVNEVGLESLRLSITRTPDCNYYKLAVLPTLTANQITNDVTAIRYINGLSSENVPVLFEDFDNGLLTGISLNYESDYTIYTIGVDRYGVESGVFRVDFSTPAPEIVGNPHVEAEMIANTMDSFTMAFTPNDDVQSFWVLAGEVGTMQQQYEMFGPMFGYSNFSDMIRAWGVEQKGYYEHTWSSMAPNTQYEVFVAMTDANGNFAPYEVYQAQTSALGGEGDAFVDIELSAYELADWYGEMLPSQYIQFFPNDEASCYRIGVYEASYYDENKDMIDAELCSDPFMPMAYWFFYEPMETDYQINPSTEVVAIAAAKNINGIWGEINTLRFTTPDECEGYEPTKAPARKGMAPRVAPQQKNVSMGKGVLPVFPKISNKVEMQH